MEKVKINYNPNGDARTLTHFPDYDELYDACLIHKENMYKILMYLSDYFKERAEHHDDSVINNFDDYYVATSAVFNEEDKFTNTQWYKEHFEEESYRANRTHPENVGILDLIEGLCDRKIVMAERMQETDDPLTKDQVYQMYLNTIKNIDNAIEVVI